METRRATVDPYMYRYEALSFWTGEMSRRITLRGISDFATEVDFTIQKAWRLRQLLALYGYQFYGEEKDNSSIDFEARSGFSDPVDGTAIDAPV